MTGKVALITGGCRGIGLGISRRLAAEGYAVAACGIREKDSVGEVLEELGQYGAEPLYVRADISDAVHREGLVAAVKDRFGRCDVLVNNAGVAPLVRNDILEATEESFERVMKINLHGPYFLTQAVARWMIEQRKFVDEFSGCIINISSISATVASPSRGEYCISKAGIGMATMLWAARLGEYDIPVYEIRPGIIQTDMTAGVKEKYDKLIGDGLCVQPRWGFPEDVGKAAASLVRRDFPYSTGQVIMVDGGLTVQRL
ncbi:MAG: 3-ketoacyl-ACP reductase [Chitinivibrionales bacterium]|nr:3-ketoacyl-ACP reductase [Chitinivibrionales bacterium]